ncbi:MAG: transporter [Candidatus Delongbacteria bacterium]|nr:transporter [Candidatus Delongbacteria bacterium]MCG2759770.1 transporter [Candidatus Delongbacteria bacterium]
MKKLLLVLAFLGAFALIQAQTGEEDYYAAENDQHSSDGTATEIISVDPIIVAEITGSVDPAVNDASSSTPDMDMTASMDASYTEYQTKINIPLWYRWRDFSFNASVPYYIVKKQPLFAEVLETSGLGDISIGAAYGKYLEQYSTYLSVNATVKLPTGDEENTEKDEWGNPFPIPLGSGSTDISGSISGFYFMDAFTFKSNILYKMNGTYETELGDGSKVETDIGDLFLFTAGADYRWEYRLTFGLEFVYGNHMASEIEGTDQKNGLQYMDIDPSLKYSISLFEFVLGAKIPVYTELETYDTWTPESDQKGRSVVINFRTNYRIF